VGVVDVIPAFVELIQPPIDLTNVSHISPVTALPTLTPIMDVAWSPQGNILAVAAGSEIELYEVNSLQPSMATLHGHTNTINSVAFSPDGTSVASGSDDGTIRIWNVGTGHQQALLKPRLPFLNPDVAISICCVAYSPDGHFLAYGTESIADIYVWDIRSGTITTFEDNPNGFIKTVLFSPDGLLVLGTGGWLSTIFSWNMKSGKALPLEPVMHFQVSAQDRSK